MIFSPNQPASFLLPYGCAIVSVALAIGLRPLLDPVLDLQLPYATVFLAILVTAWYGGFRPALAAVMLSAAAVDFFLLPARWRFDLTGSDQQIGMVLYTLTGLGIAGLVGSMQATQRALREPTRRWRRACANA